MCRQPDALRPYVYTGFFLIWMTLLVLALFLLRLLPSSGLRLASV